MCQQWKQRLHVWTLHSDDCSVGKNLMTFRKTSCLSQFHWVVADQTARSTEWRRRSSSWIQFKHGGSDGDSSSAWLNTQCGGSHFTVPLKGCVCFKPDENVTDQVTDDWLMSRQLGLVSDPNVTVVGRMWGQDGEANTETLCCGCFTATSVSLGRHSGFVPVHMFKSRIFSLRILFSCFNCCTLLPIFLFCRHLFWLLKVNTVITYWTFCASQFKMILFFFFGPI